MDDLKIKIGAAGIEIELPEPPDYYILAGVHAAMVTKATGFPAIDTPMGTLVEIIKRPSAEEIAAKISKFSAALSANRRCDCRGIVHLPGCAAGVV